MGMIKIYAGKSKPANKKPGWQKAEADYKAWLDKMNSTSLFNPAAKPKMQKATKKINPVVSLPSDVRGVRADGPSLVTPGGSTGQQYVNPAVLYKGNEEMLARELRAREKKFNAAPAYNKGNDVLMTDEMMAEMMTGALRRR